ncbi:MAG: carbohydrate kinase family protein [Candidatus Komeilibacteria bacterium]|nr:carbohydrate kinase family protein [Candidatus Komeilibacteria bacterium]
MKYDVITIGGITEDIMFHTDDLQVLKNSKKTGADKLFAFEVGDKILNDEQVLYTFGGGGSNTAVGLARLGLKVALVGAIGTDPSALKILHHFKKEKVGLSLLQKVEHYWTGLSFVISAGTANEHVIFTHRAANERLQIGSAKLSGVSTSWYYLASLSGLNWKDNLDKVFEAAGKRKVKIAWNPGATQLEAGYNYLKKYLKQTEVLILNKDEATILAASVKDQSVSLKTAELLEFLAGLGPKIVSISDGGRGAYVYSGGQSYFAKALPVKAVNTTGAGDAFGSSLIGGLLIYKEDLKKALNLAMIRGSYVVRKIGAQEGLLTLKEINNIQ